jgi:hypothetical protein
MKEKERNYGFYWVKIKQDFGKKFFSNENFESEWTIAEWYGNSWWICADERTLKDDNFDIIMEDKIEIPFRKLNIKIN